MGAVLLGGLSIAVTFANSTAASSPALALKFWPSHALANARLADRVLLEDPAHPRIDEAGALAARALRTDPSLASAARTVGLRAISDNKAAEGQQLIRYAEGASKRDVPTQLWLIEHEVTRDNVEGALRHFGIVMNVSPPSRDQLTTVLSGALDDARLVAPIARLAADGDRWRSQFLYGVAGHPANPANAVQLFQLLARMGKAPEPPHIEALVGQLLAVHRLDEVEATYRLIDSRWRWRDPASQLEGGFERAVEVAPLGWALNPELASRGGRTTGAGSALYLETPESGVTWGARRLLVLSPGKYRISGTGGVTRDTATLRASLSCRGEEPGERVTRVPLKQEGGNFAIDLAAAPCLQQYLLLGAEGGGELWVDDLKLEPIAANASNAR